MLAMMSCTAKPKSANVGRDEQHISASFDSLMAAEMSRYRSVFTGKSRFSALTPPTGGKLWERLSFAVDSGSASFNLERTQSLTTPYIGTLSFNTTMWTSRADSSQTEALADTARIHPYRSLHTHIYGRQRGRWVLTSAKFRTERRDSDLYNCEGEF